MKLNKDLMREILLQIEASPNPMGWVDISIPEHTEEEIAHHIQLLHEAGFVEADDVTTLSGYDWRARRLTYKGHEYLDAIRDREVWRLTKEVGKKTGVASAKVLFEVAKHIAKQQLAQHGVHLP